MARQRVCAGKDVQQVRAIKDRDANVLMCEESVMRRWMESFKELKNEKKRERRGQKEDSETLDENGKC